MRFAPIALVVLLVAGCLEGSDDGDSGAGPDSDQATDTVRFREPIDLKSKARPGAAGTNCQDSVVDGDCGLGEPTMEVDSRGTIYISGVCCITVAPPVYVSRDGGATFQDLPTPAGVREAFGIEGDFAIDDVGRVYFADIEFAATFQVSVWDADGTFVRHTKWPAPPLVDRDWIRAEGDGTVYYVYNTGTATNVYKSMDAAETWTPTAVFQAPFGLGNAASGLADGELWILGGSNSGNVLGEVTRDAGLTWSEETTTIPSGGGFPAGAFDEGGRLYGVSASDDTITVAVRSTTGEWATPAIVSGVGHHRMPWIAAGADGGVVASWYGTNSTEIGPGSEWFLHVALSLDAGVTWTTRIADPIPVLTGDLQRQLLDFFQVEVGPDGAIHVAYSSLPVGESNEEQLHYVRSEPIPALAPMKYFNGP
ncbi:MAG: sialidase family protein [Candidatus Thermoplasmatota archaeon]